MPEQPTATKRKPGRPQKAKVDKHNLVSFTLSPEVRAYLEGIKNKSALIDKLVKEHMTLFDSAYNPDWDKALIGKLVKEHQSKPSQE